MRRTIAFFEAKGKAPAQRGRSQARLVRRLHRVPAAGGDLRDPADAAALRSGDARWDTWRNCEFNEILAFYGLAYWYTWQVSILGLGPIWMSPNEDAKRKAASTAARRRGLCARPLGARTRRGYLCDRDGADAAARWRLSRERREVLHRQWQYCAHGLDLRQDRRLGRLRLLHRGLPAPELRAHQEHHRQPVLRRQLRAARLSGHGSRHPVARPGRVGCGAQHGQHRQVQPGLGIHRHLSPTRSTRRSTMRRAGVSTGWPSPISRTCGRCSPTRTRGWSR